MRADPNESVFFPPGCVFGGATVGPRSCPVQLPFEHLLSHISRRFIEVPAEKIDESILDSLQRIVTVFDIDRSTLSIVDHAAGHFRATHSWARAGCEPVSPTVTSRSYPWALSRYRAGEAVAFTRLADMPAEAAVDRAAYASIGVSSHVGVPVLVAGDFVAILGVSTLRSTRSWSGDFVERMRLLAEMFGSVLVRHAADERARAAILEATFSRERLAHVSRVETVGAMSAAIAHEINQPLMAIGTFAQAARRRLATGNAAEIARIDQILEKIGLQSTLAGQVLDGLRDLVRRRTSREERIDLSHVLRQALALLEIEARHHEVDIETHFEPGSMVIGDDIQLQQVVMNLSRNAIEAMCVLPKGGRKLLRIEVRRSPVGEFVVRLSDSGPGIAPEAAEKIFDPFYSTRSGGLGIGLSLCRTIVEAHGGELRHAPGAGGGAVFEFTIPAADEDE